MEKQNVHGKCTSEAVGPKTDAEVRAQCRAAPRAECGNSVLRSPHGGGERLRGKKLSSKQFPSLTLLRAIYARPFERSSRAI